MPPYLPDMPSVTGLGLEAVVHEQPEPILAQLQHDHVRSNKTDQFLDLRGGDQGNGRNGSQGLPYPSSKHLGRWGQPSSSAALFTRELFLSSNYASNRTKCFYLFCLDLGDMGDSHEIDLCGGSVRVGRVQHDDVVSQAGGEGNCGGPFHVGCVQHGNVAPQAGGEGSHCRGLSWVVGFRIPPICRHLWPCNDGGRWLY